MKKKSNNTNCLLAALARHGYRARLVPITRLPALQHAFAARLKSADPAIRRYLSFLNYEPPGEFPAARSVLVLAKAQPVLRVIFRHKGKTLRALVPPTYFDHHTCEREVRGILKEHGFSMARSKLPQKTLAVRSGLAKYGRNNIAYVPGWGSFAKLFAFWTDIPAGNARLQTPRMLDQCRACRACVTACPTGTIDGKRFLVHAGRCITYHNERPPDVPFPKWIKPGWHNCIIGCLRCQAACPANRGVLGRVEDRGRFSEQDTAYLLRGKFAGKKAKAMDARLGRAGLELSVFPRNLRAIIS
ncbi:MAG: 4Fe-4S binding protein [Candidatus Edwardsbacteria bacterium]|jgi:epoxyqueuosine reductase|nr:4Fe-4S binding protein [Candidatus Edwardsbacteria bacterium]